MSAAWATARCVPRRRWSPIRPLVARRYSCPCMVGAGLEPAPMACFCDRRRAIAATAGAGRLPAHQGKRHRFGDRRDGVNDVYR